MSIKTVLELDGMGSTVVSTSEGFLVSTDYGEGFGGELHTVNVDGTCSNSSGIISNLSAIASYKGEGYYAEGTTILKHSSKHL